MESLGYNENIKIKNKPVYYEKWNRQGIRYINDLIDNNGTFFTFQNSSEKSQTSENTMALFNQLPHTETN